MARRVQKCYIYTLTLRGGCYYVGQTSNPNVRLGSHFEGRGAEWTRIHPPVKVLSIEEVPDGCNPGLQEDLKVKELMLNVGITKVRGGSYSRSTLDRVQVKELARTLWHAEGGCIRCGRKGHWARSCYANTDVEGNTIAVDRERVDEESGGEEESEEEDDEESEEEINGRRGKSTIAVDREREDEQSGGEEESEEEEDDESEEEINGRRGKKRQKVSCGRCGRNGHMASQCYARTSVSGRLLHQQDGRESEESGSEEEEEGEESETCSNVAKDEESDSEEEADDYSGRCLRCGRNGHLKRQCYARTTVNGLQLF